MRPAFPKTTSCEATLPGSEGSMMKRRTASPLRVATNSVGVSPALAAKKVMPLGAQAVLAPLSTMGPVRLGSEPWPKPVRCPPAQAGQDHLLAAQLVALDGEAADAVGGAAVVGVVEVGVRLLEGKAEQAVLAAAGGAHVEGQRGVRQQLPAADHAHAARPFGQPDG